MTPQSSELIKQTWPLIIKSLKRIYDVEHERKRKFLKSIETNGENKTDTVIFKRPEEYRV